MTGWLVVRIVFCACVALALYSWHYAYEVGRAGGFEGRVACVRRVGPVRVGVSARVVRYAVREGWPRVMRVHDRLGGPLLYDSSLEADRVRRGVAGLCAGQRFRLVPR